MARTKNNQRNKFELPPQQPSIAARRAEERRRGVVDAQGNVVSTLTPGRNEPVIKAKTQKEYDLLQVGQIPETPTDLMSAEELAALQELKKERATAALNERLVQQATSGETPEKKVIPEETSGLVVNEPTSSKAATEEGASNVPKLGTSFKFEGQEPLPPTLGQALSTVANPVSAVGLATSTPEGRGIFGFFAKPTFQTVDFVNSLWSGRKPVEVSSAESALGDILTSIEADIKDTTLPIADKRRNFDNAKAALDRLTGTQKGAGIVNSRYWQTDGVDVEAEIIKASQQLEKYDRQITELEKAELIRNARLYGAL